MAAPPGPPPVDLIINGAAHLFGAKLFQLASFTFLIYDHIITFGDEVERVWKQPFTGATFLFFLNRYGSPLEYLPVMIAFHDPSWSLETCLGFVRYEGAGTIAIVAICELILILRMYALYNGSKLVLFGLLLVLCAQVTVSGVAMRFTERVPLPPGFVGCILNGKGQIFTSFWVAPLVTDSLIFILTLWQTRRYFKHHARRAPAFTPPQRVVHIFLRDGTMYFLAIFGANLLNVILYLTLVPDLKAVAATFSQLITSVMVSRLVLNLRTLRDPRDEHGRGGEGSYIDSKDIGDEEVSSLSDTDFKTIGSPSSSHHPPPPIGETPHHHHHRRRPDGIRPYDVHRDRFLGPGWIGNLGQDLDYGGASGSDTTTYTRYQRPQSHTRQRQQQHHRHHIHHRQTPAGSRANVGGGGTLLGGVDEEIAMMDFQAPLGSRPRKESASSQQRGGHGRASLSTSDESSNYSRPLPAAYAQALQTLSPVRGEPEIPWNPAVPHSNSPPPPRTTTISNSNSGWNPASTVHTYHSAQSHSRRSPTTVTSSAEQQRDIGMYGSQPTMSELSELSSQITAPTSLSRHPYAAPSASDYRSY